MKIEKQIKALAELDGWKDDGEKLYWRFIKNATLARIADLPSYLTSYNAIIPLIQKQDDDTKDKIEFHLTVMGLSYIIDSTPAQLAESLLRAHNLWEDGE